MIDRAELILTSRRDFVVGTGATAAVAALLGFAAPSSAANRSVQFEIAYQELLRSATPIGSGLELDIPKSVENGAFVPVALAVDSPMTREDYVKSIHLLSTANPAASVATFKFTPLSGKARVVSRMRLAESQEVIAVAELSDGTFLVAAQNVDVKVGGCGL